MSQNKLNQQKIRRLRNKKEKIISQLTDGNIRNMTINDLFKYSPDEMKTIIQNMKEMLKYKVRENELKEENIIPTLPPKQRHFKKIPIIEVSKKEFVPVHIEEKVNPPNIETPKLNIPQVVMNSKNMRLRNKYICLVKDYNENIDFINNLDSDETKRIRNLRVVLNETIQRLKELEDDMRPV